LQSFFDDCYEHINGYGDLHLSFHRILGCSEERFDAQVLLDPFEKQFHLSAI